MEWISAMLAARNVESLLTYLTISTAGGLVRIIFNPRPTFKDTMLTFVGCTLFGILAGFATHSVEAVAQWDILVTTVVSLVGREILRGIMSKASDFEKNPLKTLKEVIPRKGDTTTINNVGTVEVNGGKSEQDAHPPKE